MKCPKCGADRPLIADSRHTADGVRRRRKCRRCGKRWYTLELAEYSTRRWPPDDQVPVQRMR